MQIKEYNKLFQESSYSIKNFFVLKVVRIGFFRKL